MNQYQLSQISKDAFDALEYQFFQVDSANAPFADEIWQYYHSEFSKMEIAQIEVYHETFWKFYVYLTWKRLSSLAPEELKLVFGYQTFDACRLGFDLFTEIVRCIALGAITKQSQIERYGIIRSAILHSPMPAGKYKEKAYTVGDLVKEIALINSKNNDTMQITEFRILLDKLLYPNKEPYTKHHFVDMASASEQFFGLIHFLMGVEDQNIWVVVNEYIDNIGPPPVVVNTPEATEEVPTPASEEQISEPSAENSAVEEAPSPQMIMALVDETFEKDEQGHYNDIEGVMNMLHSLAEEYKNPEIADLLYFDEQTGNFSWNIT